MKAIETLKEVRSALLKLHRELLASERLVYERSAGPIPSAGAFLQLVAHDPWFEWLRPATKLIAEIDEAIFNKKDPLTEEKAESLLGEIRTMFAADPRDDGFGKAYAEVLQRDPHVLASHADVRRLLKR